MPAPYRDLPGGVFSPPTDSESWGARRPDVLARVLQSLGDRPDPCAPRARRIAFERRRGTPWSGSPWTTAWTGRSVPSCCCPRGAPGPPRPSSGCTPPPRTRRRSSPPAPAGEKESLGETLVRRGYAVFAPDAYWHGDRVGTGPAGAFETGRAEQESLLKLHLWMGRTLWGMFVRDDQIALDYLSGAREVDPARIGATGMSISSTRAWWLAAVDERVAPRPWPA